MSDVDVFIDALEASLHKRYQDCNDAAATPSNILLAVLNAVADARFAVRNRCEQPGKEKQS